jgi:Uma2 family endonuclease
MTVLIRDPEMCDRLRSERQSTGLDRWDEVWEGVYVMAPLPNDEHQAIQAKLTGILLAAVGWSGDAEVRAGVNVSDRVDDWTQNYRCPDVAVFLKHTKSQNKDTFWLGGPDFAVEIVSPQDSSRDKLGFYASVGVRELLVIDRAPWQLELYRLQAGRLMLAGATLATSPDPLRSEVVPLSFRLIPSGARPSIEVAHHDGVQRWIV